MLAQAQREALERFAGEEPRAQEPDEEGDRHPGQAEDIEPAEDVDRGRLGRPAAQGDVETKKSRPQDGDGQDGTEGAPHDAASSERRRASR